MDRRFIYTGANPDSADVLDTQVNIMRSIGKFAEDVLGAGTCLAGLGCIPTSPAGLTVQVSPGVMYTMETVDSVPFSDAGTDNHPLIKQGELRDAVVLTCPAPTTSGQSVNYLIEVAFSEVDGNYEELNYFNPLMLSDPTAQPWSGPNNSGDQQPTTRTATLAVTAKAGVPATSGSQTTPAPDPGYTGIFVVTVAQGQLTIASGNIALITTAPFIPCVLPLLPAAIQNQIFVATSDTGTANHLGATVYPPIENLTPGTKVAVSPAYPNTGAVDFTLQGWPTYPVHNPNGTAISASSYSASQWLELTFCSGNIWQWTNAGAGEGGSGATGPAGAAGSQIYVGASAPSGTLGNSGDIYIGTGSSYTGNVYQKQSGAWVLLFNMIGPAGAAGPQGNPGAAGAAGAAGAQGPQGNPGATGATGPQGAPGPTGAAGPQGAQGPQGNPGATGATGAQGPQGNPGATGATGAQGPVGNTGAQGAQGAQGPTGGYNFAIGGPGTCAWAHYLTGSQFSTALWQTGYVRTITGVSGAPAGLPAGQSEVTFDNATQCFMPTSYVGVGQTWTCTGLVTTSTAPSLIDQGAMLQRIS